MDFGRPMIRTPGIVARSGIRLVDEFHLGDDPLDRKVCLAANEAAKDLFLGNDNPSSAPRRRPPHPPPSRKMPEKKKEDANDDGGDDDGVVGDGNDDGATEAAAGNGGASSGGGDTSVADDAAATATATATVASFPSVDAVRDDDKLLPLVNCSLYDEQHLPPPRRLIEPGDLVVVFESFNELDFVYAAPGATFGNRNGHFPHDDFIGKPYGCKIRSRDNGGLGFVYLLRPTPELWARSLPHRTQIVHELDASLIVHYLDLRPNSIVCESGTGSGAMSHVVLRSIAPRGKLHTYEFNKMRVEKAREEFEGHGLGHLVEVHHRDVCGKRSLLEQSQKDPGDKMDVGESTKDAADGGEGTSGKASESNGGNDNKNGDEDDGRGGFQLGQAAAHAIFLDLPEPWLAVPHAAHAIKPNGRLCSYSPCVEQTHRTVAALREHGFHSLRTVEARLKEYFVDEVDTGGPPTALPVIMTEETASLEKERCANGGVLPTTTTKGREEEEKQTKKDEVPKPRGEIVGKKRKVGKILCARPFAQMKGHSAFLTFATAGNAPRPDPNASRL